MTLSTACALGLAAEDRAFSILLSRYAPGTRVLARNVRYKWGELDAVLEEGRTLVFVEIRSRAQSGSWGVLETFSTAKRQRMRRAIRTWISERSEKWKELRIDLWMEEGERWSVLRDLE